MHAAELGESDAQGGDRYRVLDMQRLYKVANLDKQRGVSSRRKREEVQTAAT